jgi:thymidylate kinase
MTGKEFKTKILIVDGLAVTGKTTLINKLKENYPDWLYIKLPPDEIIKEHFEAMMGDNIEAIENFIDAMAKYTLEKSQGYEYIVFDRCYFSTYVYQGKNDEIINLITRKYTELFKNLNVDFEKSLALIMLIKIKGKERVEKIPEKIEFEKFNNLLERFFKFSINNYFPIHLGFIDYNTCKCYVSKDNYLWNKIKEII